MRRPVQDYGDGGKVWVHRLLRRQTDLVPGYRDTGIEDVPEFCSLKADVRGIGTLREKVSATKGFMIISD